MSGPITVLVGADPISILLSAAAIRAAEAVAAGYAHAAALKDAHEAQRNAQDANQRAASEAGRQSMAQQAADVEARFEQLQLFAGRLGVADKVSATRPARPGAADTVTLAAYVRGLQQLAEELESLLRTEAARRIGQASGDVAQIEIPAEFTAAVPVAPMDKLSQRLLARIAHLGELPEGILSVAHELDATPPGERAELLAIELRARIAAHIEAVQQRQVQEATATVVEQTLKDLGYQVEEIGSTLFVEGGVTHFRRQGWGEHMVRMRANPAASTINFNVIRAVSAKGDREISVRDHLAEDRWCSEFPALKAALEARGVRLNVTRQLAAGEVPVQLVDADKLPKFADEEAAASNAQNQPMQRKIP